MMRISLPFVRRWRGRRWLKAVDRESHSGVCDAGSGRLAGGRGVAPDPSQRTARGDRPQFVGAGSLDGSRGRPIGNESVKTLSEANSAGSPAARHGVLPRCPRSPGDSGRFTRPPSGVPGRFRRSCARRRRSLPAFPCIPGIVGRCNPHTSGRSASAANCGSAVHMRSRNADRCSSPPD